MIENKPTIAGLIYIGLRKSFLLGISILTPQSNI